MSIQAIEAELQSIDDQMRPLRARAATLKNELRRLRSLAFIEANNVTIDDVELSSGDGKPWFGHINSFAAWLRQNSTRRFCEWNGQLYFTAEIIARRMDPNAMGRMAELNDTPAET